MSWNRNPGFGPLKGSSNSFPAEQVHIGNESYVPFYPGTLILTSLLEDLELEEARALVPIFREFQLIP